MSAVFSTVGGDRSVSGLVDKCRDEPPALGLRALPIGEATDPCAPRLESLRHPAGEAQALV